MQEEGAGADGKLELVRTQPAAFGAKSSGLAMKVKGKNVWYDLWLCEVVRATVQLVRLAGPRIE